MGGNNIKEHFTRRYSKEEYFLFAEHVLSVLRKKIPTARMEMIQAYKNKETFGDLDIIIEDFENHRTRNWIKENQEALGVNVLVQNKPKSEKIKETEPYSVLGFGGELQVDLIFTPSRYFDSSLNYFTFNDLGNMIGRTAASMGLRYGHKGLLYRLYDNENKSQIVKEMVISQDLNLILTFLGYDYEQYQKGFNTVENIIEFAASSKYLNVNYFKLENRNYKSRVRDKKRKNYRLLLSYLDENELGSKNAIASYEEGLKYATTFFPDFGDKLALEVKNNIKNKKNAKKNREIIKSKFSNLIVSKITGLVGKPLGYLLESIRLSFEDKNKTMSEAIAKMSKTEIKEMILSNMKTNKDNPLIFPPSEEVNEFPLLVPIEELTFGPIEHKEDVFLVDCDGVLVSWFSKIPDFLNAKGISSKHIVKALENNVYIPFEDVFKADSQEESKRLFLEYNESDHIRDLKILDPYAVDALRKISSKMKVIVVTNLSESNTAKENRVHNLNNQIGEYFHDVISLSPMSNKTEKLKELNKKYNVVMWIDDSISHVKEAINAGIENSYQFTYGMTCGRNTGEVRELDSWRSVELKIDELLKAGM